MNKSLGDPRFVPTVVSGFLLWGSAIILSVKSEESGTFCEMGYLLFERLCADLNHWSLKPSQVLGFYVLLSWKSASGSFHISRRALTHRVRGISIRTSGRFHCHSSFNPFLASASKHQSDVCGKVLLVVWLWDATWQHDCAFWCAASSWIVESGIDYGTVVISLWDRAITTTKSQRQQ